MKRSALAWLAFGLAFGLTSTVALVACCDTTTLGSGLGPNTVAASCTSAGLACQASSDCCQGSCLGSVCCPSAGNGCAASCASGENCLCGGCCPWIGTACTPGAGACCPGLDCEAADGGQACCALEGLTCTANAQCCSGVCSGGSCVCAASDAGCAAAADCCSGTCGGNGYCD